MSPTPLTIKQRFHRVVYFFPLQLLWVVLKKNHIILLFWFILFGYITGSLAAKYGVPYLFLFPEYLGEVGVMSHIILGFSCGGFIMAFNISTYIINGFRFPFLATLSRPFLKFCFNNCIIPLAFVIIYIYQLYYFQIEVELESVENVMIHIASFILGNAIFIGFSLVYFLGTNKDIFKLFRFVENKAINESEKENLMKDVLHNKKWKSTFNYDREWRVETYISNPLRIALARGSQHYDKSMLQSVFAQNHVNASYFEILIVIVFLVIGYFGENSIFGIPASASIFLLFTMLLMLSSAIHSWFKGWSITIFIVLILGVNYLTKIDALNYTNYAYGLNYEGEKVTYSTPHLRKIHSEQQIEEDKKATLVTLNNWKQKVSKHNQGKPKLIIVASSGGGLRSALWTVASLQYADSMLNGAVLNQTQLITGSSGGMIGAAFLRENYRKNLEEHDSGFSERGMVNHISQDLLNPITFTMVLNDLTLHFKDVQVDGYEYSYDRGYAFEKQLISNTSGFLDKRLFDYAADEASGTIPTMIFAPTIINDGRKLLMSSQPISYLSSYNKMSSSGELPVVESVDYLTMFKNQDAKNIRLSSVLRMNATFPYILPMVSMPTTPEIKILDAGIRDNFGMSTAIKYIYTFQDWIEENTSGVIILQVRAFKRVKESQNYPKTVLQNFFSPLGMFYNNLTNVQTYDQDQLLEYAGSWCKTPIDVVTLQLNNDDEKAISLSWHLTGVEKQLIQDEVFSPQNQEAINQLKRLMRNDKLSQVSKTSNPL